MKYKKAFLNGKIYTADKNNPWTEAVVTSGNKILFTGSNKAAEEFIDSHTEKIDLGGRLMLPGFIDSHAHTILGGFQLLSVDLAKTSSKEDFINKIKDFAKDKNGKWITGGSWNHENWGGELPRKEWIDDFTPDTPVLINRMDYHMVLANSKALKLAGITKDTPNPEGGLIMKDKETGEPTGILKDRAMELAQKVVDEPVKEEKERAINAAMEQNKRFGITSVHEIAYITHFRTMQEYASKHGLTTRMYVRIPIEKGGSLINAEIMGGLGDDKLKLGSVKAFADGALGPSTALFFEPYTDEPDTSGLAMDYVTDGRLKKWALQADKNKIQLSIHAIGDKAVSDMLDLFEEVMKTNPHWDRRPRIEHAQHIHPKDLKRFSELGVIISAQPLHHYEDGSWALKRLGEDRLRWSYAFKSFLDHGAKVCFGSDWPVVSSDPIMGIYTAVTRHTSNGKYPDGLVPEEKITVQQSIDCYTIHAAYASYEEDIKGSIEAGKLADMAVLTDDIFEIDPNEIKNTDVYMTVFDGKVIFKKE